MTAATTAAAVAALRVAYPRQDFPDDTVRLYVRMLADLDPGEVTAAVERLIRRSTFVPAIAEIRLEVAESACNLPSVAEAWSMVTDGVSVYDLPEPVRESLAASGGRFTVMNSERPSVVRAQFCADYESRRARAILAAAGADPRPQLTRAERAFGRVAELPESESITPRPVWARWLRRQERGARLGMGALPDPLPPPTDAEKHDAILVLQAGWDGGGDWPQVATALHTEAQRIMDEASAA